MVSTLIWRHVSLLYVVQSHILRLTIQLSYHYRCNVVFTNIIIDFQFHSCCTSQPKKLNQIITVNSSSNTPITKKITLTCFACVCFLSFVSKHTQNDVYDDYGLNVDKKENNSGDMNFMMLSANCALFKLAYFKGILSRWL